MYKSREDLNGFTALRLHSKTVNFINSKQGKLNEDEKIALHTAFTEWEYSKSLGLNIDDLPRSTIRKIENFKKAIAKAQEIVPTKLYPRYPMTLPEIKQQLSLQIKSGKVYEDAIVYFEWGDGHSNGSKARVNKDSYDKLRQEDDWYQKLSSQVLRIEKSNKKNVFSKLLRKILSDK